jgi:hypothetical protein
VFYADKFASVFKTVGKDVPVTLLPGIDHISLTLDQAALQAAISAVESMDHERPNHAMQPTAGPAYEQAFGDSNLSFRRHARPRQRWLILVSLDDKAATNRFRLELRWLCLGSVGGISGLVRHTKLWRRLMLRRRERLLLHRLAFMVSSRPSHARCHFTLFPNRLPLDRSRICTRVPGFPRLLRS